MNNGAYPKRNADTRFKKKKLLSPEGGLKLSSATGERDSWLVLETENEVGCAFVRRGEGVPRGWMRKKFFENFHRGMSCLDPDKQLNLPVVASLHEPAIQPRAGCGGLYTHDATVRPSARGNDSLPAKPSHYTTLLAPS